MNDTPGLSVKPSFARRTVCIRGVLPVPHDCDEARLLQHILADLYERRCPAQLTPDGAIIIGGRSEARGSVFGFVDSGSIRLRHHGADRWLEYEFSTRSGFQLCAGLSIIGAGLGWFALDSLALAVFGLLAPLLWLYGANFVLTAVRVPALLAQLCRAAPRRQASFGC